MRLFIGVPISPALADQLAAVRARFEQNEDGLRWSAPESWHITLQFLGAATPEQHDCVVSHLRSVQAKPFAIQLEELGFFDRAGVFFVGVVVSPELASLQKAVVRATCPCGFTPEDRPYHPHITLARNRGRQNGIRSLKPRIGESSRFASFTAREFLLYESFPSPQGSRYEVRGRFPLAAA
jgi:2'-5' RNA ligase